MASRLPQRVSAVRHFNRFYTKQIGLLHEHLLHTPFSLTEARVVYELAQRDRATATELRRALGLDAGYLSRLLRRFEQRRLVARAQSPTDGRQRVLSLTPRGRRAFARLDGASRRDVAALLARLKDGEQQRLVGAMRSLEQLLGAKPEPEQGAPYRLRSHRPGDMGWVVQRHGALYAQEYGWDATFEALVAEIVAKFLRQVDPKRERCWIAERHGERVGSVFCVKESPTVARLRLLLVEPSARGLGLGARLVAECVRFARRVGYRKMTLWTQSVLHAARHIYEAAGFRLAHQGPHTSFGHDLVEQTWDLEL